MQVEEGHLLDFITLLFENITHQYELRENEYVTKTPRPSMISATPRYFALISASAARMVRGGRAEIVHMITGANENDTVLNHPMMKDARSPKRLADMAAEAGMRNIYDTLYGLLSLFAHGAATELHVKSALSGNPPIYENMSLARSCLKAIALICSNRIDGTQTDQNELEQSRARHIVDAARNNLSGPIGSILDWLKHLTP
jgi:hypothetical protein